MDTDEILDGLKLQLERLDLEPISTVEMRLQNILAVLINVIQHQRAKEVTAVKDSSGCVFCDCDIVLHLDDQGFHHADIKGERIACYRKTAQTED